MTLLSVRIGSLQFSAVLESERASRVDQLAGNHFLTIHDEAGGLAEVGRRLLQEGAQSIRFEHESDTT